MDWEAISALVELAAAAGVILTLIYLANQLKQNTAAHGKRSQIRD